MEGKRRVKEAEQQAHPHRNQSVGVVDLMHNAK
jgi:hypothetical protein